MKIGNSIGVVSSLIVGEGGPYPPIPPPVSGAYCSDDALTLAYFADDAETERYITHD